MKSQTKTFDVLVNFKWFNVSYELYPDGRKMLMSIEHDSLPIDVAELGYGKSQENSKIYDQIIAAMDNNAMGIEEKKSGLFEELSHMVQSHNKIFFGV